MHDMIDPAGAAASIEMDDVAAEPSRLYDTPAAVVADDSLTREQKLRFLRAWAEDLSGAGNAASPDSVLLRLVRAAIADIESRPDRHERAPRTAQGR